MSEIVDKYRDFKRNLPEDVRLVAVSKTKPNKDILSLYDEGHRIFGENKVQELVTKAEELPKDIEWHMVGHLQRNKVKYIAPFVSLIHAVDSIKLLRAIEKEGEKNNRIIECLLQAHIAEEETKFGFSEKEILETIQEEEVRNFKHVKIKGLMAMATFTDNLEKVRKEFKKLKAIFEKIKTMPGYEGPDFNELSMGMSNDYKIAIEEGATLIRIGSIIFGERNYH
jgi:pyridoxal phosphate enzyme (YggS family)